MSCVRWQVSHVTCWVSHVACHLSYVTYANRQSHNPSPTNSPLCTVWWFKRTKNYYFCCCWAYLDHFLAKIANCDILHQCNFLKFAQGIFFLIYRFDVEPLKMGLIIHKNCYNIPATDIATYRLNWPRGQFSQNGLRVILKKILPLSSHFE